MHRKLMDGPLDARTVDGIRQNILLTYGKLTKGLVDTWKADRRSPYYRESSQKVSRPHRKLTEVDRSSSDRTKHFRKVPRMNVDEC